MVAKYIPALMAMGAMLAAFKIFGSDYISGLTMRELQEEYDYIIGDQYISGATTWWRAQLPVKIEENPQKLGGGTTGGVIASRLVEDSDTSVLLIEAGGDPSENPDINIPIFTDKVRGSSFDWNYTTVPQKHACKGHTDQVSVWPAGRGLGGTSNINYMQYLRGSRHDFDEWANQGATGWSYKDVLPYFIKSEDNRNNDYTRTIFHGYGGRLTISDTEFSPINKVMKMAFKELGVKTRDINGKTMFGYMPTQATVRFGERCGVYKAFLKKATQYPNLFVMTRSTVEKITFEGRKATGVVVKKGDDTFLVKANKEVIVSAGTIGSAKLLMLSGIGPRSHLKDLKIPVVMDLPVGANLQDHVMADGVEFYTPYKGITITAAKAENFFQSWAYSLFGSGMKASPRFREGTAYVKMKHQPPHIKYPLVGLHIVANIEVYDSRTLNVNDESYEALHGKPPQKEGFTVFPVLLHPRSRGTVRLASSNPEDMPLINPNYLAEDADVKYLSDVYRFSRKLAKLQPIKDWDFAVSERVLPECARAGNFTSSYVECFIRHLTLSGYAPVGTCKIGAMGDPTAVVDPWLRVRGTKGLRVADASIIPNAISGNTYATQVMIGEKAADIIRDKDTVKSIREYFKHLLAIKHERMKEEEVDHVDHDEHDSQEQTTKGKNGGKKVAGKKGKKK